MPDRSKYQIFEWEGLHDKYIIKEDIKSDLLHNTADNVIQLWRDDDYRIVGKISGSLLEGESKLLRNNYKSGERIIPSIIEGSNFYKKEKYRIEDCYIGNISYNYEFQDPGKSKYEADFQTRYVRKQYNYCNEEMTGWLTEWYLNGPKMHVWFMRITERKYSEDFWRCRDVYYKKEHKFQSNISETSSRDHFFVQLHNLKFIVHKIPKDYGPGWSENIGIEYRQDLGGIPEKEKRDSIAEIASFIFGRRLLNVGYTKYDNNGNPLELVSVNPRGDNVVSICEEYELSPIVRDKYEDGKSVEDIFGQLVSSYLEKRDEFGLNEVLERYWIAERLPLGIGIPILHNGIEILANNWFKSKKSKTHGVYLPKKEFEQRLNEEFSAIEKKLHSIRYGDRILNRMRGAFQTGAREKVEFFLEEIGLKIGELERRAIHERNKMIHGSLDDDEEAIDKVALLTKVYKTFFHRVLLKVLDYQGTYIDYSILGWPKKNINQVVGTEN